MNCWIAFLITASSFATFGLGQDSSIQELYKDAVLAYNDEDWLLAIRLFETSLVHLKMLEHIDITCNERCKTPNVSKELKHNFNEFPHLHAYGNLIVQANCIKICREGHPYAKHELEYPNKRFMQDFKQRQGYHYLQFAYFKTGQIRKACQAAWTFLQKNPTDESMLNNIKYYKNLPETKDDYFTDLEAKLYEQPFTAGATAYDNKDYITAIKEMERFLDEYYKIYNDCNALCYKRKAPDYMQRLDQSTSARYKEAIDCMLKCEENLAPVVNGHLIPKIVPRSYSYLQFSYYQTSNWSECFKAASSELLLDPDNELAISNMRFYKKFITENNLPNITFEARPEAVQYYQHQSLLWELLAKTTAINDYGEEAEVLEEGELSFEDQIKSGLMAELVEQITQTLTENLQQNAGEQL